ncbi:SDR family NAD(P)-dependent oxidoreductase [Allomuricauda sp. F6463D]|uniref:SDR family NAD(P)-dependent oxidoreductase n=1 Tax=Allomuricauda sp. F6463D TaxID=2926409 RepID=UPI001FF6BA02|nr:SDR family NAD(P)-dependent oxidoreductase [Muricauda sp. F6463D]MCK0160943.1 SDR family NAD(P)-dependent oxidoreductase [Muricauda sp. F6463D]
MNKNIGIMGCGWLGLPLAKTMIEKSYIVKGTTTSARKMELLQDAEIDPFQINLSETGISGDIVGFLSNIGTLIINVPPKLRGTHTESYMEKMKYLSAEIQKSDVSYVLFVSSTAVYGNAEGEVTEATLPQPVTESGKQLLESEKLFQNQEGYKTTIIRFGGLIGTDRHPVNMLSGRHNLNNGDYPINLIHLNDCIHMIVTILEHAYWGELFNGVYPYHPKKQIYYFEEAQKRGLPTPSYKTETFKKEGKCILSTTFLEKGHTFNTSIIS